MLPTIKLPTIDTGPFVFGATEKRKGKPLRFVDFVSRVNPRYVWYPHVQRLAGVLQRVADGDINRLMVFMPPRHGKSELVSRLFTAYYLYRYPERWVGMGSYAAELAYTFSRLARENFTRAGGELVVSAVRHWETGQGGGLWAAGVGGPITGKGFHLGIIDDPVKNAEEAASSTIREKQWEWWQSTFLTREEPAAAIVLIATRWHEDDLAGRVLTHEGDSTADGWHIVHYEAIKEAGRPEYPPACVLEPDFRQLGEPLAPARYPLEKLERIRQRVGDYYFSALYQQTPRARAGGMFQREWFDIVPAVPAGARFCRYWDKAGTEGGGAFTAGVLLAEHGGVYYVVDVIMGQWAAPERERVISQTLQLDAAKYGHVPTGVEQEPGSGGKESAEATIRNNPGFVVYADRPTGDKALRAEPLAAQAAARNVKLVAGRWNAGYLDIMTAFPHGIKDPVDATSGAFKKLHGVVTWQDLAGLGQIENFTNVWG